MEGGTAQDRVAELIELAAQLRRDGHAAEAREPLRTALDIAHRCGAHDLEQRAREELIAAGGRPRRPVLNGAGSLTPGELRVAELAATGMTNREIAAALYVTMKAVQWHLRNVYRKLGIADRSEIAAKLAERRELGAGTEDAA